MAPFSDSLSPRLLGRSPRSQPARRPCGTEPPCAFPLSPRAFPVSPEAEPSASTEAEVSSWHKTLHCGLVRHVSATATTAPQSLPASGDNPQIENKVAPAWPRAGAPPMLSLWLVPKRLHGNSELDDPRKKLNRTNPKSKQDHAKTKQDHRETKQDHPKK